MKGCTIMRTMTSTEMKKANGGKYRYKCKVCGERFRTWIGALGHTVKRLHFGYYYL